MSIRFPVGSQDIILLNLNSTKNFCEFVSVKTRISFYESKTQIPRRNE